MTASAIPLDECDRESDSPRGALVLLHGLGRTARSMRRLARAGARRGYRVRNVDYASRSACITELAARVARSLDDFAPGEMLDFITHSLGGIIVRAAIAAECLPLARVRRVVMLGTPNQGSELQDALARRPLLRTLYRRLLGPAWAELGTGADGLPGRLPPVAFEVGVIAGCRSLNPVFSRAFPGPNDGKVSVARAAVAGMRCALVVPHSHTFLMRSPAVVRDAFRFLERGTFDECAR